MAARREFQVLGPFRLHRSARLLTLRGRPVPLPPGAVEFLLELLVQPGADVPLARALQRLRESHPGRAFDPLVLAEQINAALASGSDEHHVAQVDEFTFAFMGPVGDAARESAPAASRGELPQAAADLIERPQLLARGVERLAQKRLVTLAGPGGVGKTTAALTIAAACSSRFADGVKFVDLAPIRQPGVVGHAVLMALDAEPVPLDPGTASFERALARALADRQLLMVLDNCEHLLEEAALVAEIALRAPGVRVLATSREPLKTFGETILPVGPMEVPPPDTAPDLATARRYDAVALFLARSPRVACHEATAPQELAMAYDVCRRLDGIPLALELAAAQVPTLGLAGLVQRLALWPVEPLGARKPTARHETLEAALDWSYNLLSPPEQLALRRLAVFRGEFPFESALALIALEGGELAAATDALLALQAKSLLQVRGVHETVQYRLLETTRDYALERLRDAGEDTSARHRHAVDCVRRLLDAEQDWSQMNGKTWIARHGRLIDDVRAAANWGLGSGGDVDAAAELVIRALPLTSRLALFDEAHGWMERALEAVCRIDRPSSRRFELQLLVSFRGMAAHTKRDFAQLPGSDERILELVEVVGDDHDAAGACMSVWFAAMNRAHYDRAVAASDRFLAIAERTGQAVDLIEAHKVAAYACHFLGDQQRAHAHALRVLELAPANVASSYYLAVGCHVRVSASIVEARTLWLFGRYAEAAGLGRKALQLAQEDRPLAVCLVLSYVLCPMALWNGEFEEARAHVERLEEWSHRHNLKPHQDWARWYRLLAHGNGALTPADVPPDLEAPDAMQADMFCTLGCAWLLPATAERIAAGRTGWSAPEVQRRQGEQLLLAGRVADARRKFREALDLAEATGVAGWGLRAATSLAELEARQGDRRLAADLLTAARARVDHAHATADTLCAARLLREWADAAA